MTAPRGHELFRGGLLIAHRTTPVHGHPAEVWELLPALAKDESFVEMFVDAARLQHERPRGWFAKIEAFDEREYVAVAPPWVQLHTLVTRNPSSAFVATYLRDVARELAADHILYRGLSPTTLAITITGRPRMLDLTLAKFEGRRARPTQSGVIKGQLPYLSPELLNVPHRADSQSDIYALGLIALELLSGTRVHRGADIDIVRAISTAKRPPVPGLERHPPRLLQVIEHMLDPLDQDRHPPSELVAMLEANLPQLMWTPEQMFEEVRRVALEAAEAAIVYAY
jgi:serine/threonine protein kinase